MDSIRILSNYEIQLINLNEKSLTYWHNTALKLDSLLAYEQAKVRVYSQITGYQNRSLKDLEQGLVNKKAIDDAILGELRSENKTLKIKNTILGISVGVLIFETAYLLIIN